MVVDLEYVGQCRPQIVGMHLASKRELAALHLDTEAIERTKSEPVWCLTLFQEGPNANYCDHCYVWQNVLFQAIGIGAKDAAQAAKKEDRQRRDAGRGAKS